MALRALVLRILPEARRSHRVAGLRSLSVGSWRQARTGIESGSSNLPWELSVAVLVERSPLTTPKLTDIQERMLNLCTQVEHEQSLKCDHELRHEADLKNAALRKADPSAVIEDAPLNTAADDEDVWQQDAKDFFMTYLSDKSQFSQAEEKNDNLQSIHRMPDRPLRLVVKRIAHQGRDQWDLPSALVQVREGETLRAAAERALLECCGPRFQVHILGNAPWAVYKLRFPRRVCEKVGCSGHKVFLMKAFYNKGVVEPQDGKISDFRWSLAEELSSELNRPLKKAINRIIIDESP